MITSDELYEEIERALPEETKARIAALERALPEEDKAWIKAGFRVLFGEAAGPLTDAEREAMDRCLVVLKHDEVSRARLIAEFEERQRPAVQAPARAEAPRPILRVLR